MNPLALLRMCMPKPSAVRPQSIGYLCVNGTVWMANDPLAEIVILPGSSIVVEIHHSGLITVNRKATTTKEMYESQN